MRVLVRTAEFLLWLVVAHLCWWVLVYWFPTAVLGWRGPTWAIVAFAVILMPLPVALSAAFAYRHGRRSSASARALALAVMLATSLALSAVGAMLSFRPAGEPLDRGDVAQGVIMVVVVGAAAWLAAALGTQHQTDRRKASSRE